MFRSGSQSYLITIGSRRAASRTTASADRPASLSTTTTSNAKEPSVRWAATPVSNGPSSADRLKVQMQTEIVSGVIAYFPDPRDTRYADMASPISR